MLTNFREERDAGNSPNPVPDEVEQHLHREAYQKKHVEAVEYFSKGCRNVIRIRQASVELRLCDSEDKILQKKCELHAESH
jgi:hypothetical protein